MPKHKDERFLKWVKIDDVVGITEKRTKEDVIHALSDALAKAKGAADDADDEMQDDHEEEEPETIKSSKNMRAVLEVLSRRRL